MYDPNSPAVAFHGHALVGEGRLIDVARAVKCYVDANPDAAVLTFDAVTSTPVELDLRGSADDVIARMEASAPPAAADNASPADNDTAQKRGPGRPKLGVVAREVTLLPRHWEWLAQQPGGASVTLRKLVEQARKNNADANRAREARDATYRFMFAVGGDLPHFEEVSRALYAGDEPHFRGLVASWPPDVRAHTTALAERSFEAATGD